MERIRGMAQDLADGIASSIPYKAYAGWKSIIMANPALLTKIQLLKRTQWEQQSKIMQNIQPSIDDEKYIGKLYAELMLNEDAKGFLTSETEILRLLQDVYGTIGNSCEIETFMP